MHQSIQRRIRKSFRSYESRNDKDIFTAFYDSTVGINLIEWELSGYFRDSKLDGAMVVASNDFIRSHAFPGNVKID